MEIQFQQKPQLKQPNMIAAWPGMGYLAKISADYLRRRVRATLFAEIKYYHNVLLYSNGKVELAPIRHKLYASMEHNLVICVGDAQPSIPEESIRLAEKITEIALQLGVKRIYTMAAYPNDVYETPRVYGIYTDEAIRSELEAYDIQILEGEGNVNGLNGVLIGVAKTKGIDGVCLLGDITYANVPQHLASKAVVEKLAALLNLEIDTEQLMIRAERIDASIKRRLDIYEEDEEGSIPEEKKLGYIS